jgi:hypothetical protein
MSMPPQNPDLVLPFSLRGYAGSVLIRYGANRDAAALGFGELGLPFPIELTHGFPICEAEVEFAGSGYFAAMGWIQVVTVEATLPERMSFAEVDRYPAMRSADSPFVTFGHLPRFFDAPGPNPPRTDETWTAEAFLAICGDVARTKQVQPVLGFRWGYRLAGMRATPKSLEIAGEADWMRCTAALKNQFPNWEYLPAFLI